MPFVSRGADRQIVAVYEESRVDAMEQLREDDPQLIEFLSHPGQAKTLLSELDSDMVRVIDDLIEVLIAKQLLLPTDLPEVVQQKLLGRQLLRQKVSGYNPLVDESDII